MALVASEVWSDLHHGLKLDSKGSIKKVSNVDSVITSIDNILGTMQGERVMQPTFASKIGSMLFEPITERLQQYIADEVKEVIERWDARVTVTGVDYSADQDRSFITMSISFRIRGYDQVFTIDRKIGGQ